MRRDRPPRRTFRVAIANAQARKFRSPWRFPRGKGLGLSFSASASLIFFVILSAAKDLARSAYASRRSARRDSSLQQLSLRMTQGKEHRKKQSESRARAKNLTPNPFPSGKGNQIYLRRAKWRPRHFAINTGCRVTPAARRAGDYSLIESSTRALTLPAAAVSHSLTSHTPPPATAPPDPAPQTRSPARSRASLPSAASARTPRPARSHRKIWRGCVAFWRDALGAVGPGHFVR